MADISGPIALTDVFTQWRIDWVTLAVTVAVGVGYIRVRVAARRQGHSWPIRRDVIVAIGLLAALWTSCGFLQARSSQLMWVWTTQQLLLLLVIPVIVLAGQPLSLLRMVGGEKSRVIRTLGSRPVRLAGHPLLGPLLVPVLAAALFFGGLGVLALTSAPAGWGLHLLLLGVGALIALPLVDRDDLRSSLAVGLALGVGLFELMLDSFPGIVLSFQTHLTMAQFGVDRPAWAGSALDDQHTAGGIMWAVAEILDLPFLVLAATRWLRADALEARRVVAELDAQDDARAAATDMSGGRETPDGPALPMTTAPKGNRPWWLDDPELRDRYRG
ncbi:MAG: cytochrome c oxidase assembly protein [Nakamurella sp.]